LGVEAAAAQALLVLVLAPYSAVEVEEEAFSAGWAELLPQPAVLIRIPLEAHLLLEVLPHSVVEVVAAPAASLAGAALAAETSLVVRLVAGPQLDCLEVLPPPALADSLGIAAQEVQVFSPRSLDPAAQA